MDSDLIPLLSPRKQPAVVRLPQLTISGLFFGLENGQRHTLIGATEFNLFGLYQKHGGKKAIAPTLQQMKEFGYNTALCFTIYDLDKPGQPGDPKIGILLDPNYALIPEFTSVCAEYGIYVLFIGYSSWNDPRHWDQLIDACLKCPTKPLIQLGNEMNQPANITDPLGRVLFTAANGRSYINDHGVVTEMRRPVGLLASHGSNGSDFVADVLPVEPVWDWFDMHWNVNKEWYRKAPHNTWEAAQYTYGKPGIAGENPRYPDNCSDVRLARGVGEGLSLLPAGGSFHSVSGKRGLPWQPGVEADAALAWAEGMRSIPTDCQPLPYRRLDPGDYSRIYQRNERPVCIARIPYPEGEGPPPNPNPGPDPTPPDPTPEPPQPMKVGYFTVVSSMPGCGDHRADVADFTTLNIASSYNENEPKAQNGAHSFAVLAQERKFMLWWPNLGSGSTMIDQACLDSIAAMVPQWPAVDAVLLDEVGGDEADVDRLCDEFTAAVESFGLEPKPLWVGFTVEDMLHRTGYQSNRIDVCVFEAYIHPRHQNELDVLDILDDIIDSQLERLGARPKAMVCQGYRQERGGIKWTNMQSLSAVNRRTIERAKAIDGLQALLIFTLVRPPADGSLEIGLVPEHRALLT